MKNNHEEDTNRQKSFLMMLSWIVCYSTSVIHVKTLLHEVVCISAKVVEAILHCWIFKRHAM